MGSHDLAMGGSGGSVEALGCHSRPRVTPN
jgi:hypothetical protein